MKLGLIGRAWLGFQTVQFVRTVVQERRDYQARMSQFHGYSWTQVKAILKMCYAARPDFESEMKELSDERRLPILTGIFTCPPTTFHKHFGFDRPHPS